MYEVIEDALRDRYDLRAALDDARQPHAPDLDDEDAMALAVTELRETRAERQRTA